MLFIFGVEYCWWREIIVKCGYNNVPAPEREIFLFLSLIANRHGRNNAPAPGCEIFLLLSLIANRHGRNNAPAPERETTAGNATLG